MKVEPKSCPLIQDVGLRQRGLGGIPVGAVSGTCNNHRDKKFSRALSCRRSGLCLCGDVCLYPGVPLLFLNEEGGWC